MTPRGLGLWAAFLGSIEGGDLGRAAARLRDYNVGWIALRSGGNARVISPRQLGQWRKITADLGVGLYTWNYSYPSEVAKQAKHIASLFSEGIDGHIIDAEIEWQRSSAKVDTRPTAIALGEAIRTLVGGSYVGHAPFAIESFHGDFPYEEFGEFVDEVHPQSYWTEFGWSLNATISKTDLDFAHFNAAHPHAARPVRPIGVSYGKGSTFGKPPGVLDAGDVAAFLKHYTNADGLPGGNCSIYSWEAAMPAFWAGLDQHYAPPAPPPGPPLRNARDVQTVLSVLAQRLGDPAISPGVVDGIWGPKSQHGLEAFERHFGMALGPISDGVREQLAKAWAATVAPPA